MVTGIVPTYFRSQVPYSGTRFVELSLQKRKKWHVTFAPMVLILMLELIVERLQVFAWLHSVTLTHIWALSRDHKTSFTEYKLLKSTRFMLSPRHAFLIGLVKGSRYRISICIKHASTRHRRVVADLPSRISMESKSSSVTPPSDLTSIFSTQSLNFSVRLLAHSISINTVYDQ